MASSVYGTLSADGNTSMYEDSSDADRDIGVFVLGSGTWGSGTLKLQILCADGTWRDLAGQSFVDDFAEILDIPIGSSVRGVLSGSTSPSLYYQISSVRKEF